MPAGAVEKTVSLYHGTQENTKVSWQNLSSFSLAARSYARPDTAIIAIECFAHMAMLMKVNELYVLTLLCLFPLFNFVGNP
jgi:hypothetical protein